MPLYEYQCDACRHRFEQIQKFSDPPLDACPECGGAVRKLLSSPAIQFKGSGWYVTDYAKKPAEAKEPSDAGKSGTDKKTPGGDAQPAAGTDSKSGSGASSSASTGAGPASATSTAKR